MAAKKGSGVKRTSNTSDAQGGKNNNKAATNYLFLNYFFQSSIIFTTVSQLEFGDVTVTRQD